MSNPGPDKKVVENSSSEAVAETATAEGGASAQPQSFSGARRNGSRRRFALNLSLLLWILFVVNGIAFRSSGRIDFTEEKVLTLAPETQELLDLVGRTGKEIRVVFPYSVQLKNSQQKAHHRALVRATDKLKIYSSEQPLIRVDAALDINDSPDEWNIVCEKYDLSGAQFNRLIFFSGESNELRQTVMPKDVATFQAHPSSPSEPMQINFFRGEAAMTEAIKRLINQERLKCYFTQGHGEFQLGVASGMMALRHDLRASGFEPVALQIGQDGRIPEDCALLVIAAPKKDFSPSELDAVDGYLAGGGKLLVALGAHRSKLESVLKKWGVEVFEGRVKSILTSLESEINASWVACRNINQLHSVTSPLVAGKKGEVANYVIRLLEPRSLKAVSAPFRLVSEKLFSTGGSKENERYYLVGGGGAGGGVSEQARSDFTVAVATQQQKLDRPPENWEPLATRVIVLGSGSLLLDRLGGFTTGSHRDFVMNCFNWLVEKEDLVTSGGARSPERRIRLAGNPSLRWFVVLASLVIFPGVFLLIGGFVYYLRRS